MARGAGLVGGALVALAALLAAAAAAAEPPTIYKWVDENGIAHYTTDRERIPRNVRNRIRPVERGPGESAPEASAPAAGTSRPGREAAPATPAREAQPGEAPPPGPVGQEASTAPPPPPAPLGRAGSGSAAGPVEAGPPDAREARAPRPAGSGGDGGGPRTALDERIAELEGQIRRDEDALKAMISGVDAQGRPLDLEADARLDEIAQRLPRLQADLERLRGERAALDER